MRTIDEIKADIAENNKSQLANRFERSHVLITEFLYAVTDEVTLDRLEEICNAERDGRLVVLPCETGDAVYWVGNYRGKKRIVEYTVESATVFTKNYYLSCGRTIQFWRDDIGKTVFLTKEAAEQALKGGKRDE